MMYIIFCKLNLFIKKATLKSKKKIRIYNFFLNIFLLFYFRFTKTTQYVIPLEYLDKLKVIYIKRKKFLIPFQTLKYLEWRYGNNWKIPNKNWR